MADTVQIKSRLNKRGKPSILLWQGMMYGTTRLNRIIAFFSLAIIVASLSFTQLGFIGVGYPGNYSTYAVALLAPIALAALLLGVWPGTMMGLIAGGVLYLHASNQPLDYYEVNFVTPMSAIVLFTATALLIGLLLAVALRKNPPLWRRIVYMALVFLFVSILFTLMFTLNVIVQLAIQIVSIAGESGVDIDANAARRYALGLSGQMGDVGLQILIDSVSMLVSCIAADIAVRKAFAAHGDFGLRTKFRGWLFLVASLAFTITAGFSFAVITEQAKNASETSMQDEIHYLIDQLKSYETRFESLANVLLENESQVAGRADASENGAKPSDAASTTPSTIDANPDDIKRLFSIENLLSGYSKEEDGTIVVLSGDVIVASNDPEYEPWTTADEYFGNGELQEVLSSDSADVPTMVQAVYDERVLTTDDIQSEPIFDTFEITTQIVYMSFGRYDDYTIMMITPAGKVFAGRTATMAWISISAFVLLLVVFAIVSFLLGRIVVRRIDETNGVLSEITDGNLEARVDIRDSREFASLSTGINTTVDTLKDWIAEAESRISAELATAKEIQEAALPRTFPPFPDIRRFDIYASMNAAKEVGGDFYDFFLIGEDSGPDEGKLGFVMADVSGKGVPAALFMMKAKTQIRDYLESGMELGEAIENANRQLCDGNDAGMFVTAWVGVLDYASNRVEYVNAGHNPPLLWQETGGWRWLEDKSGLPLGLFDGFPYEAFSVECRTGDEFLLYTDGVTEAMSVDGELYGEERLIKLANDCFTLHPRALVDAVRRGVAKHAAGAEQSDDITVLALEVGVPPEVTATIVVPADVNELPRVNEFIHTELDRRLCPVRTQNQLDIAVEELFVNVAHYAYPDSTPDNPGTARISYTYSAEPPSVKIGIADDGIPYNPLAKPDAVTPDDIMEVPIGGLGILMAKNSVDDMTYERIDGSNVVTITKKW